MTLARAGATIVAAVVGVVVIVEKRRRQRAAARERCLRAGALRVSLSAFEASSGFLYSAPAISTITFYEGDAAAACVFLRERVSRVVRANPWLGGKLVRDEDDIVSLRSHEHGGEELCNAGVCFERCAAAVKRGPTPRRLAEWFAWSEDDAFVAAVLGTGAEQMSRDGPVFQVSLVPIVVLEGLDSHKELYAIVVSACHAVMDGHDFYALYGMLSSRGSVAALETVREPSVPAQARALLGSREAELVTAPSLGMLFGIAYNMLFNSRRRRLSALEFDQGAAWAMRKAREADDAAPFVSSNDVLASAFFRAVDARVSLMALNLRGRLPQLAAHMVGNYETFMIYQPPDFQTPALVRRSLQPDSKRQLRRAAVPLTALPTSWDLASGRTAVLSNWASFYSDLLIPGSTQRVHACLPDPRIRPPLQTIGVIFRPAANRLAIVLNADAGSEVADRLQELLGPNLILACNIPSGGCYI